MNEIKDVNAAIGLLINAANVACKRGASELDETRQINSAIDFLKTQAEEPEEEKKDK